MFTNAYVIDRNSVDGGSVLRVTVSPTGPTLRRVGARDAFGMLSEKGQVQ